MRNLLDEDVEILYLYVPIMFMYLYYLEGVILYLNLGVLAMLFPAYDIANSYYLNGRIFLGKSLDTFKMEALYFIFGGVYLVLYFVGMATMYLNLSHSDFWSGVIFASGIFLGILCIFSVILFRWTIKSPDNIHSVPDELRHPLMDLYESSGELKTSDIPEEMLEPLDEIYDYLNDRK